MGILITRGSEMAKPWGKGIITPILTPIRQDESVNYAQFEALINHLVEGGVDAIFVMGSSGEFARFDQNTRAEITRAAVRCVAGRVPVYAGIADTGLALVKRNLAAAEKAGADAVVATMPYYFPTNTDEEAYIFFDAVASATSLPLMLYNIPGTCGASIGHGVVEKMLEKRNVIGIKDSSGDAERLEDLLRIKRNAGRDFAVVVGSEELSYDGLSAGADGLVPSLSNPFPRLFAQLYAAARDNDLDALRRHCDVVDRMNNINSKCGSWMAPNVWRKKALAVMGVCDEYCTAPWLPVDAETEKQVVRAVEEYRSEYVGNTSL